MTTGLRLEARPRFTPRTHSPGSAPAEEHRDARRRDTGAGPSSRPGPLRTELQGVDVIVVDDDLDTVELFAAMLQACGAEVRTATRAAEVLALVTKNRPDVVVSDIAMPGGDGYWLVRELGRLTDGDHGRVPVVAATAYGREHSRARVLGAGFVDHLQKPVDPETLCRAVARAAGR